MRKYLLLSLLGLLALMVSACFKDLAITYDGPVQVEFETAVRTNPAPGRTYPLVSVAANLTATTTIATQLNLVGPQRSSDLTVRIAPEAALTTALPTSYTLSNGGNVTIPANSSFGSLTLTVSRATSTTAPVANLVLLMDSTSNEFKASPNYRRIGYTFRQ